MRSLFLIFMAVVLCPLSVLAQPSGANGRRTIRGELQAVAIDDFQGDQSRTELYLAPLESDGKPTRKHASKLRLKGANVGAAASGSMVRVTGIQSGSEVSVESTSIESQPSAPMVVGDAAAAVVSKNVAVLLVNFSNDVVQCSTAQVQQSVFGSTSSASDAWRESSYGQLVMGGQVFPNITINATSTGCNWQSWEDLADTAARNAGIPIDSFTNVYYVFPPSTFQNSNGCAFAGIAYIGGRQAATMGACQISMVYQHEFGHNLGMDHAGDATGCQTCDPTDVMGYSTQALQQVNAAHKVQLGWVPNSRVQLVASSGNYTVAPLESSTASTQTLDLPIGTTGRHVYVAYRQATGYDAVMTNLAYGGTSLRDAVHVVTGNPSGGSPALQKVLATGQSWTDPNTGAVIQYLSGGSGSATVQVAMPGSPQPSPTPSPSPSPTPTQTPNQAPQVTLTSPTYVNQYTVGTSFSVAATASDADGTVSKVEFFVNGSKLGEDLTAPYSLQVTANSPGSFTFVARATDNLGATRDSAPVTITINPAPTPTPSPSLSPSPSPTPTVSPTPSPSPSPTGTPTTPAYTSEQWGTQGDIAVPGDYFGTGKSALGVFRPSDGTVYIREASPGTRSTGIRWGARGDVPVSGDFLGLGHAQIAQWRPGDGVWYIYDPITGQQNFTQWGVSGDVPVPGDYFGTGRTDLAVFRSSEHMVYIRRVSDGKMMSLSWGSPGDVPVSGDFLGLGHAQIAQFRPSNGTWYILDPLTGQMNFTQWGTNGDIPLSGRFLDGTRSQIAVFRPADHGFYIRDVISGQTRMLSWGTSGDVPLAGDFSGLGRAQPTQFRPSTGTWWILNAP